MNKLALLSPAVLALAAGLPVAACSSNQNHAERDAAPEAQGRPDYAHMDIATLKQQCIGPEAGRPSINGQPPACTPDPGSRPVDQARAQAGYHFVWVWNLSATQPAKATYTYDDNTALFVVPERDSRSNGAIRPGALAAGGWEPPADAIPPVPGITFGYAVRFRGGPFTEYGGGFGQSFRTISNTDGLMIDENGQSFTLPSSPEFSNPGNGAYDLRTYEGLAIWVRRGPLGMSTMRLGVTERNSAEDLNSAAIVDAATGGDATKAAELAPGIAEAKHCRRWRLCGCAGGTPCTNGFCYDPSRGETMDGAVTCGVPKCRENNTSSNTQDPLFTARNPDGSPAAVDADGNIEAKCTLYQASDGRSDMFCYDPARNPPPPSKRERCNNPFSRPITVTTDWQLIKVPFTELLQADEGNVSDDFDLASIKQIVVTHGGGWVDFWIANVGFYKKI